MVESLNEIDFMGLLGNNKFNSIGETNGMVNVAQLIGYVVYYI